MPITFNCQTCSNPITVDSSLAGKKGTCKKCRNPISVPAQIQPVKAQRIPPAPLVPAPKSAPATTGSQIPGEFTIWTSSPSQIENFGKFLLLGVIGILLLAGGFKEPSLFLAVLLPAAMAFGFWLNTRFKVYELTNQRLRLSSGVFSKITEDIELFRDKDTKLSEPFFLRLFGMGNVNVISSDIMAPIYTIVAVSNPSDLRETLRAHINEQRTTKGVREVDMR